MMDWNELVSQPAWDNTNYWEDYTWLGIRRDRMQTVCYYHANCFDGMAAAWVVSKKFPDAEFIPYHYGDEKILTNVYQDCCENANINTKYILVDISFPRDIMELMHSKADSMIVIDHHKTAEEACKGLSFCIFDMRESGASLAWKTFFPAKEMPIFIRFIADRDLWRFELDNSREVNSYIQSYPINMENYEFLHNTLQYTTLNKPIEIGTALIRYQNTLVNQILAGHKIMNIDGYSVPVVNCSILMSEVGHALCKLKNEVGSHYVFGAYYFDRADGMRQWGARSIGEFDVSEIARNHGGGGHRNAAGWQEDLNREG